FIRVLIFLGRAGVIICCSVFYTVIAGNILLRIATLTPIQSRYVMGVFFVSLLVTGTYAMRAYLKKPGRKMF
ncbi:hypothetical protein QN383_21800, partial [Pseudomonas sp. AA4]|uniref:hypothetical protein n=1 Tax=Pseudomonas sp. AA4 TaxID=3048645 RepID=UPI002B22558A